MSSTEADELLEFLVSKRPEVRQAAASVVQGLSATPDGIVTLIGHLPKLVRALFQLIPDPSTSETALNSLVNLSQDGKVAELLLHLNIIGRVMDYLREIPTAPVHLMVMLLSNVTVPEAGSCALLQLDKKQQGLQGLHLSFLMQRCIAGGILHDEGRADQFEHVASIATNVSRVREGRIMMMEQGRGWLQALAAQLRAPSLVRRRGVAHALRNLCVGAEQDGTLEALLADPSVLTRILQPLSGQEPRETDDSIRESLAEAVLAVASTEAGAQALWDVGAAEKLRQGYEDEQHPGVCMAMESIARVFMGAHQDMGKGGDTSAGQEGERDAVDQQQRC